MAQTYYRQSAPVRPPTNRTPPAVAVASDLLFAAHLLDATRAEWLAGVVPDADRYTLTLAERSVMHATLDALGPVVWRGDCAPPPVATDADRLEWAALLRGGVPAPSRPLPDCTTYHGQPGCAPVLDGKGYTHGPAVTDRSGDHVGGVPSGGVAQQELE